MAQQRGLDLCDLKSTERAQLRPGVEVEELARKECDPLGGGELGDTCKETG